MASSNKRDRLPYNVSSSSQMSPASRDPQRATPVSSSTSVNSIPAPSPNAPTTTLESLLAIHSSSRDPKLAALDQAISERNTLSSQNAQLWKLIEKQRTGYNQILKELERVRNERDSLKAKLGASSGHGEHRHRSRDNPKPSEVEIDVANSKLASPRTTNDEQATPKIHQQSFDTFQVTNPLPSRTPKASLPPLFVPPRAESLPVSVSPSPSSPAAQSQRFKHSYSDSNSSTSTSHSAASSSSRIHNYPRKNSNSESIRSLATPPPNQTQYTSSAFSQSLGSTYHPPSVMAPSQSRHTSHPSTSTITAKSAPYDTPMPDMPIPTVDISPVLPTNSPLREPIGNSKRLLLVINDNRAQPLSRESRISLPDEAKKYIASMGESPLPSPQVIYSPESSAYDAASSTKTSTPENPTIALSDLEDTQPQESSEFLDMDDEDLGDDYDTDEDDFEVVHSSPNVPSFQGNNMASPTETLPPLSSHFSTKPHAVVDDFPLPPLSTSTASITPDHTQSTNVQSVPNAPSNHGYPTESDTESSIPPVQSLVPLRMDPTPHNVPVSFRALPLLSSDLPYTTISVSNSFVRPNDRGKEVLSFVILVNPGKGKESWKVEKLYSDVITLDQRVRSSVGKGVGKKIATLPEGKLWRDHAPAKVDQRKAVLESYLITLIRLPVKSNDEVVAFFTSDIVRDTKQPVLQAGHKEGYLTKRGKNFGGWKTRYFVLSGPVLEYYDCRGGAHLGSITITGAQIGRQQRTNSNSNDDEKEYRHAFLIVEAKRGPGGNHPRHVLCAESDDDRDGWVDMLVRYFSGRYSEGPIQYESGSRPVPINEDSGQSISSSTSNPKANGNDSRVLMQSLSRDDIGAPKGSDISASEGNNLFPAVGDPRSSSPARSLEHSSSTSDRNPSAASGDSQLAKRLLDKSAGQPSSFPDSSPLSNVPLFPDIPRATSEMGHYPDLQDHSSGKRRQRQHSPEKQRHPEERKLHHASSGLSDRVPSPEKMDSKVKISRPLNGAPIPAGYKFGGKDPAPESSPTSDRREKAKSRSFWGFGRPNGSSSAQQSVTFVPRAVFGVPLDESLDVASIANLPAIVFRSIQYLETKQADQEEGIYRLSGSSAVIKSLKDRFNAEGDVDLLASDEYWDPHAIAGLLKSFLRELPASILTRELHLRFLAVIDFTDPQERIRELSHLIASLPLTNYSLLRALTAHLILIVQNSSVNKMTMRNVGIVFSPTLGIPAGVFSLMLGEFNRVFNVNTDDVPEEQRRNSQQYSDAAADELLGLNGRQLAAESQSDGDDISEVSEVIDETSSRTSDDQSTLLVTPPVTPPPDIPTITKTSKASNIAAMRGLNVSVTGSERGNRHSRMIGLPASPRPPSSPMAEIPTS